MMKNYNLFGALFQGASKTRGIDGKKSAGMSGQLGLLVVLLLSFFASNAQVTTNSGSGLAPAYGSLDAAITALNGATITSPVVITLTGDETAPAGGYVITAQGTAANTIIIEGVTSTVTASAAHTAGNLNDAIFKLVGADYVTIQSFILMENAANTDGVAATNTMTEWGVALLYASATDGAQNNTIQNNTIDLNRSYVNTFGIYSNSTHTAAVVGTLATATGAAGGNHGLKIYGNSIMDVNIGIVVVGPTAAADHNDGLDIGGIALATGNTITDYGTTGTFSPYINVSASVNGILVRNTKNFNVSYNSVTSSNGGVIAGTLRGIYIPAFNNAPTGTIVNTVNNNVVSLRSGVAAGSITGIHNEATTANVTTTLNINNNNFHTSGHTVAGTGTIAFIQNAVTAGTLTINSNTFSNLSVNTTGTTYLINNNCSTNSFTVNGNVVAGSFSKTGAGGIMYGYYNFGSPTGGTAVVSNNNFSNISVTGATNFYGIRQYTSVTQIENIVNNNITNIVGGTSGIFGISHGYGAAGSMVTGNIVNSMTNGGAINGINLGDTTAGTVDCYNNWVYGLSTTGASTVSGISLALGVTNNIYKNKIYNLEANNAAGAVNGILVASGTTENIYNNLIGDLRTPVTNAANPLNGINITGGTTVNVYYNTVMLNGSSTGALFGSSAISAATGPTVTLRNNIFVNNSAVMGAGLATAYRRSSTTLTTYGAASNNNVFYGSTYFTDGTNTDATLAAFKARVAGRDASSISENPAFVSVVGANAQFLHINTAVPTLIEGGASPIASYTDDFDGDVRNASTPDIGADEFAGTSISVVVINSISPNPIVGQCTAASRPVTASVTAGGSDITSVTLNYSFNGVPQTPIAMIGGTLTAGTTSDFTAVIPAAVPANATVAWSVSATDPFVTKNTAGNSYQDEPLFGKTATANASVTTFCGTGTSVLSAAISSNGAATIGTGTTLTGTTEELTAFCNRRISYRMQLVYTAAELNAAGLSSGPITALTFNINSLGSSASNTLYTVKMGATGASTFTDFISNAGFTTVFPAANYTHAVGQNVINFSTPYVWDGVSNVVVEVTHNGIDSINNAQTYYTATAGNTVVYAYNGTATGTLSTKRFNITLTGASAPAVTNYSWSDGSTVVGTGNNLSVSPTVTTTYTATLTSLGCTIVTNPITITVATTPAAPTASVTVQPTCSVPTGTIAVTAPIGATLEYSINGIAYQAGTTFAGVIPGTYNVTVRDTNGGCVSTATSVTVNAIPAAPSAPTVTLVHPTCSVPTGSITVTAPLGATLEYSINGGAYQASTTFSGLISGNYNVTVRDTATGCVSAATSRDILPVPAGPSAPTASVMQPDCIMPWGTITVDSPVGASFEYSINGVTYQASTTFTGVTPGTYNVTVRDIVSGCTSSATVMTINPPTAPGAPTGSSTQVISVAVPTDATIEDIVVTGSNIIWYPTSVDALAGTNALPAGTVLVSGSSYFATQTVGVCTSTYFEVMVTVTLGTEDFALNSMKVYPNPVTDILTVENAQAISGIEIYTITGQKVLAKTVNSVSTTVDMSGLASGAYFVKVTSDSALKTIKVIKK